MTDFSNYRKFSNKNKYNINEVEIKNDILINHGRAFSSMGIGPNKAFIEANKYINFHKIKKIGIGNNNKCIIGNNKKNSYIKKKLNTNINTTNNVKASNINTNYNINNKKNKIKIFMHINHDRSKNKSSINGMSIPSNKDKENYNYNNIHTDKNFYTFYLTIHIFFRLFSLFIN